MWRQLLFILPLVLPAYSIRVPVENNEQNATEIIPVNRDQGPKANVFYISDDAGADSYLVPPDPHKHLEPSSDTLATYLVPPAQDRQSEYYIPTDTRENEWLPIQAQSRPDIQYQSHPKAVPIFINPNYAVDVKGYIHDTNRFAIPIPSTHLEPPSVDAVNEFIVAPEEIEIPADDQSQPLLPYNLPYPDINTNVPVNHQQQLGAPTLTLHLVPPTPQVLKSPTKLYPKKYTDGFKPLPIPVEQFAEDDLLETPKAKPVNYFKPQPIAETDEPPSDKKNLYHYKKAEHQRKLKGEDGPIQPHQLADGATQETYGGPASSEQETSETNFRYPGRNVYTAPLRQAPTPKPPRDPAPAPAPDGRTEFRMHGMKGPHSYQFGYDTGKGKNRQFRYEERDNDGLVHGHYGYMGNNGKLRVVNYSAHPEYGFHAEEPQEKE